MLWALGSEAGPLAQQGKLDLEAESRSYLLHF